METFLDRLLELGGQDHIAGRLALMKDERGKAVLRRVAELAGGLDAPAGRARGVAFHKSFGSYVAQIAEVSAGPGGVPKVHKVWAAADVGVAINPNIVRAQIEGGIGFGLGHALYSEITLGEGGVVEQSNFDRYRSLRIAEMPAVEVAIIKSGEKPTGIGEPGLPPAAPAVANAWRKLTGKTVTRLPFIHTENTGAKA
jgi:isoquinoline 1-oxidoreductase beta subunit